MKTLVAYASKHGCVKKCAHLIADGLKGEVDVIDVAKTTSVDVSQYDVVVIGGSVYAGQMQKAVVDFGSRYLQELLQKRVGLFVSCGQKEMAMEYLNNNLPAELVHHSVAVCYVGYEYNLKEMNFLERTAVKIIAKVKKSESNILEVNIGEFTQAFK